MLLIYGAPGYTGELIAREAVRRGLRPILAGRNAEKVNALARELACEARVFDLRHIDLSGVSLVLHCAGPFRETSEPMVRACLDERVHYLDITGEIAVFEAVLARDAEAKARGVVLLPGVGFDVVPTDCLAAMLAERLPDATELWLAFMNVRGSVSRGTFRTAIDGISEGGAIRRDGKIVRVPMVFDVREIPFSCGTKTAVTIPWGDVSTAFHTTGIPNIRVYRAMSPRAIAKTRRLAAFAPLLRFGFFKRLAQRSGPPSGPSAEQRANSFTCLWGRAFNDRTEVTLGMTTDEGYTLTMHSALAAAERVLATPKPGAWTPARYFGPEFVLALPNTRMA